MSLTPEQSKAVEAVLEASGNPEFPASLAQCILEKNGWDVAKTCDYVTNTPINEIIMRDMRDRFGFTPSVCRGVVRDTNGKPIEAWKILNPSAEQELEERGLSKHLAHLVDIFPSVNPEALKRVLKEVNCNFDVAFDKCLDASGEAEKILKDKKRGISHPKPNYLVQEFLTLFEKSEANQGRKKELTHTLAKSKRRVETGKTALSKMKQDEKRLAGAAKGEPPVKVVCVDKQKAAEAARVAIDAVTHYTEKVKVEAKVDVNKKVEEERKAKAERRAREEAERKARAIAEMRAKIEEAKKRGAEKKAREEAERKAKAEAEKKAKEEAERKAKEEEEAAKKAEAERKAREEEEEAAKKAEEERKAKEEEEEEAAKKAEAERKAREEEEAKVEQIPIAIAASDDNNLDEDYPTTTCDDDIQNQLEDDAPESDGYDDDEDDYDDVLSDKENADDAIQLQNEDEAVEPTAEVVKAAIEQQEAEVSKLEEEKEKCEEELSEIKRQKAEIDNIRQMRIRKEAEKAAKAADGVVYGCKLSVTVDEPDKESSKSKYVVHVSWEMERQLLPRSSDWIGLFLYNREFTNKYEAYRYSGGCNTGTIDLPVEYPGCYDVRFFRQVKDGLFSQTRDEEIGRSTAFYVGREMPLTVENKVTTAVVSWNKDFVSCPDDWFAVFPVGQHSNRMFCLDKYYKVKNYMDSCQAEVDLPRTPGNYEIRYFYSKSHGWDLMGTPSYPFSGRSEVIEVKKRDCVSVVKYGQKVVVDWGIYSEPYSSWNYVSIHEDSDPKSKCVAFGYISKGEFNAPEEGQKQMYDSGKVYIDMSRVGGMKDIIAEKKKEQKEEQKKAKESGEKYEAAEIVFNVDELPDVCKSWEVRIYTPNCNNEPLTCCRFYNNPQ